MAPPEIRDRIAVRTAAREGIQLPADFVATIAAEMRVGSLEETLTVQALGITGALYRTLRTTNPIENLNGSVAHYSRNVKRWGDGQMVLRWVASALSDAATRMRKLRGCGQMRTLLKALDGRRPESDNGAVLKAA